MCKGLPDGWHVEDYTAGGHEPALLCFLKGDLMATLYERDQECSTWSANGHHDKPYDLMVAAEADHEDETPWDYVVGIDDAIGFLPEIERHWVKTRGAEVLEYNDNDPPTKCHDMANIVLTKEPAARRRGE